MQWNYTILVEGRSKLKCNSKSSVLLALQDLTEAIVWDGAGCVYRDSEWREIDGESLL